MTLPGRAPVDARHRPGGSRCRRGFTLVELLVVTAILGLVVGVVGACLSGGIRVWETARVFGTAEAHAAIGLRILERDVMNSFPFYSIPLTGSREGLSLAGPLRDEQGTEQIGTVLYRYDRSRRVVERKAWAFPGDEPSRGEVVVPVAASLSFRYLPDADGDWVMDWSDPTNRPLAIEVEIGLDDSPFGLKLTRTIVPAIATAASDDKGGT